MIRQLLIFCLTMALAFKASAAEAIQLERLDIRDGLSQNTITSILQDAFGFIWMGTKDGLNLYDGTSFTVFKRDQTSSTGLGDNYVKALCEDNFHNIWIGTDCGLYVYDRKKERISAFPLSDCAEFTNPPCITATEKDSCGNIWVVAGSRIHRINPESGVSELAYVSTEPSLRRLYVSNEGSVYFCGYDFGGIYMTSDNFKTVTLMTDKTGKKILDGEVVTCFVPDGNGRLLVGSEKYGVTLVDPYRKEWNTLPLSDHGEDIFVRCILKYSEEELWIGTEDGVIIYNLFSKEKQHIRKSYSDPHALADNAIYSLCRDSDGGIWIGTFFGGVNYLRTRHEAISRFYPTQEGSSIGGLRICGICPDGNGKYWIGTEDAGLYYFNPQTGESSHVAASDGFTNVHGLLKHGDELWICTFACGLKVMNTKTGCLREYHASDGPDGIQSDFVFNICECRDSIYVGTAQGVLKYDGKTDSFSIESPVYGGIFIRDMKEDHLGNLWVATMQRGVFQKDAISGVWTNFSNNPAIASSIASNNITGIFEDYSGTMWFATEGKGICKMKQNESSFENFNSSIGFPSDLVCQITEDDRHRLWISSIGGLVCFDPQKSEILHVYTIADGLLSNQFNYNSCHRDPDGKMWFGSIGGLICFYPDNLSKQITEKSAPVYITELNVSDALMLPELGDSPLTESILSTSKIKLSDKQRSISLKLVSPSYMSVSHGRIEYIMEGLDDQWRALSDISGMVYYPQLPAGHYVFKARAGESERALQITVIRPPMRSTVAFLLYIVLFFGMITSMARYYLKNKKHRELADRAIFEAEKEKELYDAKLNFFTMVAHEIRTPLSLIKGPLENILEGHTNEQEIRDDLKIMSRNTNRLLDLVGELLDFNKVENKAITLNVRENDIVSILRDTVLRFSSASKQKGLSLELVTPENSLVAELDEEYFTKIISNLLNNALKYSKSRITVTLSAEKDRFLIFFSNDGESIEPDCQEKIFEPFFRINNGNNIPGSGMGLPFARSIARLHDGDLTLNCSKDEVCFILSLPYKQACGNPHAEPEEEDFAQNENARTILVVEDNTDMRDFISRQFRHGFRILKAADGKEAMALLEHTLADLVITDLMMPVIDGLELCHQIKSNPSFSHIPVIILSAKTSTEAKISGSKAGADVYVEKPFSPEYLVSVVNNLFENREILMQRFLKHPFEDFHGIASSDVEDALIGKIQSLVRDNLPNPDFNMDDIASSLAMSRATFYRKIKGLLDMSPNDYLKIERLKVAAKLLCEQKYNVNEIAYMVGFNSPSYFSKCFLKQFGIAPKDFGKS